MCREYSLTLYIIYTVCGLLPLSGSKLGRTFVQGLITKNIIRNRIKLVQEILKYISLIYCVMYYYMLRSIYEISSNSYFLSFLNVKKYEILVHESLISN